jgi:hypothetical protein
VRATPMTMGELYREGGKGELRGREQFFRIVTLQPRLRAHFTNTCLRPVTLLDVVLEPSGPKQAVYHPCILPCLVPESWELGRTG